MSYKYSWTVTSNHHYDATLTQSLVNDWIADQKDSSGRDSHMYYITGVWDETWHWPSSSERMRDTGYHYETETDEPMDPVPVNSTYELYENFTQTDAITLGYLGDSVKYLKIEAATNGVNRYDLSRIA